MEAVWIESLHNLHCPHCDSRLLQRAGRHFHSALGAQVYVGDVDSLACPDGHRLPGRDQLYDYRAQQGHAAVAPVSEVGPLPD
ncbi:hypothetical protein [Blastococcus sp. PRF04-17]|uniref:hypothetical protein n=1 Tax=Blastococcus sp. PRF04-17 TaxID=2933797 RepID=UPI001FF2F0B7|nr:hypothetical protein [Blastococcus sp. PRF04-17]UOX99734.1 hypothetical protein MVA48_11780 [Blastococcus sp. PRF04-17]